MQTRLSLKTPRYGLWLIALVGLVGCGPGLTDPDPSTPERASGGAAEAPTDAAEASLEAARKRGPSTKVDWSSSLNVGEIIDKVRHAVRPDPGRPELWRVKDATYLAQHQGSSFSFAPHHGRGGSPESADAAVTWQTVSVAVGPTALTQGAPTRSHHENRVDLRWSSVREFYVHRDKAVEQAWEITALPKAHTGDLVIKGQVQDAAFVTATRKGLHFAPKGTDLQVAYSPAKVFDAAGRKLTVQPAWDAASGQVHITVPEQWLAQAVLPVVVDPDFTAEAGTDDPVDPALNSEEVYSSVGPSVAFDGTNFIVVWVEDKADEGDGVYATIVDDTGSLVTPTGFAVSVAGALDWQQPRVTSDGGNWYVVWADQRDDGANPFVLRGALINDTDLSNIQLTEVTIADGTTPANLTGARVASDGNGFFVVFEADQVALGRDVYYRRIDSAGALVEGSPTVMTSILGDQVNPDVSGDAGRYMIVWDDNGAVTPGIRADTFQSDAFDGRLTISNTNSPSEPSVTCDQVTVGANNRWYCTAAWTVDGGANGDDIRLQNVRLEDSGNAPTLDGSTLDVNVGTDDQNAPQVSRRDEYIILAYAQPTNGGDVGVASISSNGSNNSLSAVDATATVAGSADAEVFPVIAAGNYDGGAGKLISLVAWNNTTDNNIEADILEDDGGTGTFVASVKANTQTRATVAAGSSRYLVAWVDERNGFDDIYATRVDPDGTILDSTGIELSNGAEVDGLPTACDVNGTTVVAWVEDGVQVKASRVTLSNGTANGPDDLASALTGGDTATDLDCASNGTDALVVWLQQDSTTDADNQVTTVLFDTSGSTSNLNNDITGASAPSSIAVASDGTDFLVGWIGTGGTNVFAHRVNADGTTNGAEVTAVTATNLGALDLAFAGDATYAATVATTTGGDSEIVLAAVAASDLSASVATLTTNSVDDVAPALAVIDTGHVAVIWQSDDADGDAGIEGMEAFVESGAVTPFAAGFAVQDSSFNDLAPSVFGASDGKALIAYERYVPNEGTVRVRDLVGTFNRRPSVADDTYAATEDTTLSVNAAAGVLDNDTEPDGDAMTVAVVDNVSNGTLNLNTDGSFTYTPAANFSGTDTFTYTATDGTLTSKTATVTINVAVVDDPPVAVADSYSVDEEGTLDTTVGGLDSVLDNDSDEDSPDLDAFLIDDVTKGVLVLDSATGDFLYEPNTNETGTDTFTYQANDGTSNSNTVTVTITINPINDAPVAVDDPGYGTNEDEALTVDAAAGVLANDTDVEGDALTASLVSNVSNGALSLNADGSFTYTPTLNFFGTDSFTYRVNDGTDDSANTGTVTITVASVNDPPVANADNYAAVEEQLLTVPLGTGVLANDSDTEGSALTITLQDNVDNGTLNLNTTTGAFTYTGNTDFFGTDSFTYSVSDGDDSSNTVTVNITVSNVQDPPSASNDTYSTSEDTTLSRNAAAGVLANDTDPDGDTLTVTVLDNVDNGTLSLNADGSFTYDPNLNFNGTDSFTYTLNDGNANTDVGTVTININNTEDAPTVTIDQDTYNVDEGASTTVSATASDPDEPAANLTFSWDLDGDGNFGDAAGDSVTFNAVDGPLTVSISVRVTDSANNTATDNATVEIANLAPVITTAESEAAPLDESAAIDFTGAATDAGDDTLSFSWDFGDGSDPGSGETPSHTYEDDGTYTVTLTVTDSDGAPSTQSFDVTILDVPPELEAIVGSQTVNEGSSEAWSSRLNKARNDDVNITATWGDGSPASNFSRTGTATTVDNSANHTYDDNGTYTITFLATDDDGSTDQQTLIVTVNNVAPTIDDVTNDNNLDEGDTFSFSTSVSDPGTDTLSVSWDFGDGSPPESGTDVTHEYGDDGTYTVTVTVTDDDGASDINTFDIDVSNANPTIGTFNLPASGDEGEQLAFSSAATDPAGNNDPLTYTWDFGDGSDPVVGQNPNHTYTQNGTYTVRLTVTDDDGGSRQRQDTVTISNVTPSFDATTIPNSGDEGEELSFSATASDPGDDTLTYTWSWGDGTPNTVGRNVNHTFADDTDGPYTVTVTVTDQDGASPAAVTQEVTVANRNPSIDAISGQFGGVEGQQLSYTATVTDPAGANDTLTYTWDFGDGSAQQSGVDRTNVNHTYVANGTYTITLTIEDEDGGSTQTTRTVNIGGESPIITSLTGDANGVEGATFDFTGLADEPGEDPITYSWHFGDPAVGDPCNNPDEQGIDLTDVSYTYADDGAYVVTLCAEDNDGSVSQTFNVTVTNADPSIDDLTIPSSVREAQSRTYAAATSDPGADTITVTWSWGDGSDDTVGDSVDHTYPDNGTYELTVTVTDEDGGSTIQTVDVSVSNRNPSIDSMTVPANSAESVPVNFTATASDPAGANDPLTYTWDPGDGTPALNGTNVTHTYADNGSYTVTLTVTDGDGGSVTDTRTINVSNTPPEITTFQGSQLGDEADTYSYSVVASDSAGSGDPLTYTWDFGDGSPTRSGGNLNTIDHIYADNGTYTVTLTVDDGDGGVATRTLEVTVRNVAPTIQGTITGTESGNEGGFFTYNAVATDPGADTLTYTWELADGSSDIVGVDRTDISHVFRNNPLNGNRYTIRLTVTDDDGATDTEQFNVTVNNVTPVIRVGASQSGPEGGTLTFRANSSDPGVFNDADPDNPPDPDVLTYTWDFGDGSDPVEGAGLSEVPYTYRDNGIYTVTVTVTDSDGASDEGTIPATVGNVAPTITSSPILLGAEGELYEYQVTLIDPANTPDTDPTGTDDDDNDPITYRLLQSPEGMSVSPSGLITWTPTPEQAIEEPPVFTVSLRVEDGDGGIATQQWDVNLDFQDRDGDGSPDECEDLYAELNGDSNCDGDRGADACGDNFFPDYDGDGITNTRECLQGSNPVVSDAPGAPSIFAPADGDLVAGPIIILEVTNAPDPNNDLLEYTFELYSSATLEPETLIEDATGVRQQPNTTSYILGSPIEVFEENAFYWWRAKANDLFGEGPWSDVATFQFSAVNDSPSVPVPMMPNIETNARSQASFVFANATDPESDAITYEVEVYLNNADQLLVLDSGSITSEDGDQTTWTMPFNEQPLADDTPHLWRVRAVDSNGATSDWSELVPFVVSDTNEPPTTPKLMYPEDNQVLTSMDEFFFLLGASTDDDNRDTDLRYTVVVSRERGCPGLLDDSITDSDAAAEGLIATVDVDGNPVEVAATLDDFANTDAIFDAGTGALTENRTYHWCVFAFDGSTRSGVATSSFRYSSSNAPPSKVVLTSPIDDAIIGELSPDLVWRNAEDEEADAIVYNVQIAADADFTQILFDANFDGDAGASTTLQSPGLAEDTSYWWRVRASDPTDDGEWSDPGAFRVNLTRQLPSAPVLLAPADNEVIEEPRPTETDDPAFNFAWENATDPEGTALEYELWILPSNAALDRVFATEPLIVEADGGTTTFDTTLSALNLDPDRYSWIVRAIKTIETADGTTQLVGPWSNARSFSVQGKEPGAEEIPIPEPDAPEFPPATETCECSSVGGSTSTPSGPLGLALVGLGLGIAVARRRRSDRR